jgi:hypothetical protein
MRSFCGLLLALGLALIAPMAAHAQARVPTMGTMFWPFGAPPNPDPEKPMCVGVQTVPWGDGKGNYTGGCRYGAPLGPMQAAIRQMDRKAAVGNAKELGLSDRFGARLQGELDTIAGLPMLTGRARLKRYAQQETTAAKDGDGGKRASWIKHAAVNCAIFGAVAGDMTLLWEVTMNHKLPPKEIAKSTAFACAAAVLTPSLNKWIKGKGYDMEA